MILIKVADISNEARPMDVAEPWLDRLMQEFFAQSAAEKSEGLPVTPFMDPDKVSRPGSQVRFIGLVILPLFEALGDLVPEIIDMIIVPVRAALDYYKYDFPTGLSIKYSFPPFFFPDVLMMLKINLASLWLIPSRLGLRRTIVVVRIPMRRLLMLGVLDRAHVQLVLAGLVVPVLRVRVPATLAAVFHPKCHAPSRALV